MSSSSSRLLRGTAALVAPPVGLLFLWMSPRRVRWKLLGTLGLLLYSALYTALVIWLLIQFTGLEIEWRGGYLPAFTYHKTVPNYAAVEKYHASLARPAEASTNPPTQAAYWAGFRGPNRDGLYDEQPIRTNWPADGPRLLWRQPCGGGYGSFAGAGGIAYTIEQRRSTAATAVGSAGGGAVPESLPGGEQEVLVAYDLQTGHELWTHAWPAFFTESMGGDGPRSTPTYDDGKIYPLGAQGDLSCVTAQEGHLVWSKNILADNHTGNITYGMAASPLIVDDKLIVQPGGASNKSVVAYNKVTGAAIWGSLDDPAAYSSPMVVTLAGQRQLLVVTATRAVGLVVEDGKLLWEYPWIVKWDNRNIVQPIIVSSNRFLLSASYTTGCALVEVLRDGSGRLSTRTVWKNKSLKNKFASSVFWQGNIYGLDEDILTCLDAETGERRWKEGHYGYGQLLLASAHLVILSGEGEVALVRAVPDGYHELARFQAIHGKTWNVPAIAEGKLLVRNAVEMACFDLAE